jgi:hypothetical protein
MQQICCPVELRKNLGDITKLGGLKDYSVQFVLSIYVKSGIYLSLTLIDETRNVGVCLRKKGRLKGVHTFCVNR